MATALFVVKATIKKEHEDAFNRWYNDEHVPHFLRFPGAVSARRGTNQERVVHQVNEPLADVNTPDFYNVGALLPGSDAQGTRCPRHFAVTAEIFGVQKILQPEDVVWLQPAQQLVQRVLRGQRARGGDPHRLHHQVGARQVGDDLVVGAVGALHDRAARRRIADRLEPAVVELHVAEKAPRRPAHEGAGTIGR